MRVSIADHWCAELKCPVAQLVPFLNEVKIDRVVAFDTDEGWVDVQTGHRNGERVIARRYGRVEVKRWKQRK